MGSPGHPRGKPLDCSNVEELPDTSDSPIEGAQKSKCDIHTLHFEVIAYIFEFYVDDAHESYYYDTKGAFPLGAVCQLWRHIAWTSPRLWTTLMFALEAKTTKIQVQLAIEWINRSGDLPLSVTLSARLDLGTKEELILPLVDVINQSLSRCRHLDLAWFTAFTYSRFSPIRGGSVLRTLKLCPENISSPFDLGSQAAPTYLEIFKIHLDFLVISWKNLTHFSAIGLYIDEISHALILAPQLKTCSQYGVKSRTPMPPDEHRKVIHSQLEDLEFRFAMDINHEAVFSFFQNTTFTNLAEFICDFGRCTGFFAITILRLLYRSSCSIEKLTISEAVIESEDLIEVAKALPSLTSLKLHHEYESSQPPLDFFFNALCHDSRYADRVLLPGDVVLLPSLASLDILTCHQFPWAWLPGLCYQRLYDDDNTCITSPIRPHLKYIAIDLNHFEPDYDVPVDEDIEEPPDIDYLYDPAYSLSFPTSLVDTWETFSELMTLRKSISRLYLSVKRANDESGDLFDQSYKKMEASGKKAPDDIRDSYKLL